MIIKCFRCGKDIDTPNSINSDYTIADDFIMKEKREQFFAVNNEEKLIPIKQAVDALLIPNVKRIEVKIEDIDIQKTGLVCPECYRETDTLVWGIHKLELKAKVEALEDAKLAIQ